MSRFFPIVVVTTALLVFLTGCHFSVSAGLGKKRTTTTTQATPVDPPPVHARPRPAAPPIRGEWSEPVNGIRMMTRQIAPSEGSPTPRESITLLVFAWNASDRPVQLPTLMPEPQVRYESGQHREVEQLSEPPNNLRILAEPLGQLGAVHEMLEGLQQRQLENHPTLLPGEVRLHAITLRIVRGQLQEQAQELQDIYQNSILESRVNWFSPHGEYKLQLVYRPEGFDLPEDRRPEFLESIKGWEGKEIRLPPIHVFVSDPSEARND